MRHFLFMSFMLLTICSISQDVNNPAHDSQVHKQKSVVHEITVSSDSAEAAREAQSTLIAALLSQKERKVKEKSQAMLRIALGALFLVVLMVGLMRRKNTKKLRG